MLHAMQQFARQQRTFFPNWFGPCISLGVALAAMNLVCGPSSGQAGDPITLRLDQVKSSNVDERTTAAKFLIDDWPKSLQPLINELAKLDSAARSPKQTSTDMNAMIGITDALRSILANKEKEGAITKFRTMDDDPKVIQALAWMARSDNRDLRINSTYILANVVDNTNVCIVLDHLRDPAINPNGRINLLQTVAPVAGYAYMENVDLIQKSLPIIKSNTKSTDNERTIALVEQLNQRLKASTNAAQHLATANITPTCPAPGLAPLR
jgi:hypothetical protein